MFTHIFFYRLKVLLGSKETIFWTLAFPIALSLFFSLSLSGLDQVGQFSAIPVAVVEEESNPLFESVVDSLSQGEAPLLDVQTKDVQEALALLNEGVISGIITVTQTPRLTVQASGLNQSILKSFLDEFIQTSSTASRILEQNPSAAAQLAKSMSQRVAYTQDQPVGKGDYNMVLGYYYALIAMTCFYGGFFGMEEVNQIQANLSKRAARVNLAPVHKMKVFVYSLSASILIHLIEMALLLCFLVFVLKIDFGSRTPWILLTTLVGALTGVSFGSFISATIKASENAKSGIFIGITMFCSFLAGLMFGEVKYMVETNLPLLARINPVNLLADSYYSLYVYDSLARYSQNIASLIGFSLIFTIATYLMLRRRTYASI